MDVGIQMIFQNFGGRWPDEALVAIAVSRREKGLAHDGPEARQWRARGRLPGRTALGIVRADSGHQVQPAARAGRGDVQDTILLQSIPPTVEVAQGRVVHLFVVPKAELRDVPFPSAPAYARVNGWSTASWTQGDVVFLTLTKGDEKFLNKLLAGPNRI